MYGFNDKKYKMVLFNPMKTNHLRAICILALCAFPFLAVSAGEGSNYHGLGIAKKVVKLNGDERSYHQQTQVKYETDEGLGANLFSKAENEYSNSHFREAQALCIKALPLLRKGSDKAALSDCLNLYSITLFRLGDFKGAIQRQQESYELAKQIGDKERISSSLNTFAGIYLATKQLDASEKYIKEAISIERKAKDSAALAIRLGMASDIYLKQGHPRKALPYIREALYLDKRGGRYEKAAVRLSQLADIYMALGRRAEARKALEEAMPTFEKTNNKHSLSVCYNQMGQVSLEDKKDGEAIKFFIRAITLCKATGNRYVESKAQHGMWQVLRKSNPMAAMSHLERYTVLADSLFQEESAQQLSNFRAQYETAELNMQNEEQAHSTRVMLIVSAIIFFMLILVVSILSYALSVKSHSQRALRNLERVRTNFFTNITHEFRTPLTVILGLGNELSTGKLPIDETVEHAGAMITNQGNNLLQLVNQLLDISKVKSAIGEPEWRIGNIVIYLRMTVESFQSNARLKNINLLFSSEETNIQMDFVPEYLGKMLRNLISNAIKYTPEKGSVFITAKRVGDKIQLQVADTGRGIPADDVPHIFDVFYQGANSSDIIGTGVGLSLVRELVEAMNGHVTVDSALGKGSVFTILLPLKHGSKQWSDYMPSATDMQCVESIGEEQNLPDNGTDDETKPIILIVEDNNDVSYYIGSLLKEKYYVNYAKNGDDGLKKAQDLMPDLIVSDIMMPGMDGFELCRCIRNSEVLSHIPIIIITAKTTEADRVKGIKAGADAYLYKPFNADELIAIVERQLEQSRLIRDKYSQALKNDTEEKVNISQPNRDFLNKVIDLVYAQMNGGNTESEFLASQLCMSRSQLNRKLLSITGQNTQTYVIQIRISCAKRLLDTDSTMLIGDIAMKCGFDDVAYFSRIFKKMTNMTPSQYRKRVK